jgi:polysaccharide biosynthesis/export protein
MHSAERIISKGMTVVLLVLAISFSLGAQSPENSAKTSHDAEYILGPGDQIRIWALGVEEITDKPLRVDPGGDVDLPTLGRMRASGLTVEQFRGDLLKRLAKDVKEPRASVDIVEFGSQPVSVIGAVGQPGVHQLQGRKTLAEVLSMAGGLKPDAGPKIKVTREIQYGEIPLSGAKPDPSGKFSVAEVTSKGFLAANNPVDNILIFPHDVITVPQSEIVYVVGAVRKPGGFTMNDRETISVLQALALAEGLGQLTAADKSKIIRSSAGGDRTEIPVDMKKVMAGKATDVSMQPNDILFIPGSASKQAAAKVLETTLQTISGIAIWRGF